MNTSTSNSNAILDAWYKDAVGAAEVLSEESCRMCASDGTVNLNACNISKSGMDSIWGMTRISDLKEFRD